MSQIQETLSQLENDERLKLYQVIVDGCQHLWSKNKLQEDKLKPLLDTFIVLAEKDPYFLAHFTSYAMTKLDSKDLKVVATYINSLSDADGTPFSAGSKFKKPQLRVVSQAAIQMLDPKLVTRVIQLANMKQGIGERKEGTHFSRGLKTAVQKYLKYREANPKTMEGIKKVGFARTVQNLYRHVHLSPSDEAASILGWKQKDGREIVKKQMFDFKGMDDLAIAQKIRDDKLPPTGVLGALPTKISPVIAVAILEQASGDQAVILRELFDSQGLLKNKEVMKLFKTKLKSAKTALDRVDRINTLIDEDVSKVLKTARADKRKEQVGEIGKVFMHIDISSSMDSAIDFAKERGAIVAECIPNPEENFFWGVFNSEGQELPKPESFEKDAFQSALYGYRAGGMTNCMALYERARQLKCDVDIFVTDQGHNGPSVSRIIAECDAKGLGRPKAVVIVNFMSPAEETYYRQAIQQARYRGHELFAEEIANMGIPVAIVKPDSLIESALVAQAIKTAVKGQVAIIEEIMSTPLLKLPEWWGAIS